MRNLEDTILSQYANSPALLALIEAFNDAVDPSPLLDSFYENIWNVMTATGYGLDVWGRIVGVSRILTVPGGVNFGFDEAGIVYATPFNQQAFFTGIPVTGNYSLTDAAYRILILAKALSNISNCSIHSYNVILQKLFPGRGNAFVSDLGAMQMLVTFEFTLAIYELAIIKQSGAFVAPTGVGFSVMQIDIPYQFGFVEAGIATAATFNNGAFFKGFL